LNTKILLGAAVLSVIESIRNNPDKFNSLIHYEYDNNTSSATIAGYFNRRYYSSHTYEQQQGHSSSNDSSKNEMNVLIEEGEKLFNKLARESVDEVINYYARSDTEKAKK
jgi:hypothetical protein